MSLPEIEERLEEIVRVHGEEELNKLRDKARVISEQLHMHKEFEKLNRIISALLTTKTSKILTSPLAKARAFGIPYDPARMELFEILFRELKQSELPFRADKNDSITSFRNFAFFESYFSNYIEGTVFEIDEAKEIIRTNKPIATRNKDSHDILGMYQLVSNKKEIIRIPVYLKTKIILLEVRHL